MIDKVRAFEKLIHPRWSIEIIYVLGDGPRRYSEIQHQLTIEFKQKVHPTTLTANLAQLQSCGLVDHDSDKDALYRLTKSGAELVPELDRIADWIERHSLTLKL